MFENHLEVTYERKTQLATRGAIMAELQTLSSLDSWVTSFKSFYGKIQQQMGVIFVTSIF